MTKNSFDIKIRTDILEFLRKMELFKLDNYIPEDHYADSVKEISRKGAFRDIYEEICKTYSYDIMLIDGSIFQFHKENDNYRYCFMQSPKVKYSWEEYLYVNDLKEDELTEEESNLYRSCYDNDEEDSFRRVENPMYIRYDVSGEEYFECYPVKMTYRELWKEKYDQKIIYEFHKQVKRKCESVNEKYWSANDQLDLFLV